MRESLEALILASAVGTAFLITHITTVWAVWQSRVPLRWKWMSLVPVLTPLSAWHARKASASLTWLGILAVYVVIRLLWLPF